MSAKANLPTFNLSKKIIYDQYLATMLISKPYILVFQVEITVRDELGGVPIGLKLWLVVEHFGPILLPYYIG